MKSPRKSSMKSPRKSSMKSPRKSPSKLSRKLVRKSRARKINLLYKDLGVKKVKFSFKTDELRNKFSKLSEPLSIYTQEGCPACKKVKKICKENEISCKFYNRKDHEEYVSKNSNNYMYVPAIFNREGEFIGGTPELENIINKSI